jgi:5-methylcytosine-specific restriction endonuclease McrA
MITTAPLTPWLLLGENPTMRAGLRLSWFMWSTQMVKRKALSAKARFEIFKRDAFTCQYCGSPWSEPKAFTYFCGICWRLIKEGVHV